MTKHLLFLPFLAGCFIANAQQPFIAENLAAHSHWLGSLSRQPIKRQQQMIADRLMGDTAIAFQRPVHALGVTSEQRKQLQVNEKERLKNKTTGIPTPLILINGNSVNRDYYSAPDPAKHLALSRLIITSSFKKITSLTSIVPAAIYGAGAANGILIMDLRNNKELKRFQELYPERIITTAKYHNNRAFTMMLIGRHEKPPRARRALHKTTNPPVIPLATVAPGALPGL